MIGCPCTVILSRQENRIEAQERAGYFGRVSLVYELSDEEYAALEAAHVLLHADEDPAEYVAHRGVKETEAESVAYVVAGILGFDTSAYSVGYVAGWSQCDAETIKATAANVLRTTHTLADALTTETEAVAA